MQIYVQDIVLIRGKKYFPPKKKNPTISRISFLYFSNDIILFNQNFLYLWAQ